MCRKPENLLFTIFSFPAGQAAMREMQVRRAGLAVATLLILAFLVTLWVKIRRLPDTTGMKNEVIIQKSHRYGYDHAVRNVGIKMIEVESREELERAVNDRTAMMLFFNAADPKGQVKVEEFVQLGKKLNIPTFNDAAADLSAALRDKGGASGDWTLYSQLGIAYYNLKRYDETIVTLQKALALKLGHNATSEFLGKAYLHKGIAQLQAKGYDAALDNLRWICEHHLDGQYSIEVIDLAQNPRLARTDQIVAVPTLVRQLPQPIRKIIGDLSNRERVIVGLRLQPPGS